MTATALNETKSSDLSELIVALEFASKVCQFLAHSVLQKTKEEVNQYQNACDVAAHERFRSERKIILPRPPISESDLSAKPVFKISFTGHNTTLAGRHPATDPMLLAFKSCNNWCRKHAGFQMVASSEPEDSDDDLSEEGR
mmetsp:Transcript_13689/g.20842  ORF Transcript_13689/g.20842 Transcript_13689/m.20842 type:complete len:141 (+) Transcript_13689:970-1392(+)|eukprot:CAMPEP_0178926312 /NCGR_PEP_ID=MMETSP0786-20121207/18459_1 /TAXON_ID=186022 /ORGANISM="Thalassionema frauenfeldii, Strain CCMP 1798" /LENGTH=140 /DNA_ID=CAMNT_0020601413 /DNA_START=877 /DNA_END=1299 /DNA_ORIENTATION=+